ncbi:PorP/SprF family type IX secretion system membrane protein [Hufsiella ginkgonis]|uniref:Type IX secretion system membrane protein PorP/SprF n=1 Tax=Hufsiella ginkgonis TaxID=2695274 RepID=A0A7K1Y0C4_9SPHI|nr:type IX secretion system membrane protein PorP/SprF [Hufsiella ginkgonis]MXV16166.1 type IX secretion system membrane protein PorP/SprF [Hufsiella ginkgonis]
MKRLFVYSLLVVGMGLSAGNVRAQQAAMYSQYMFNALAVNPAYAGSRNVLSATALYRTQWTGIKGAPQTGSFTMDAPFYRKRIGAGIQIFNDQLGITKTTGGVVSGAYRIRLDKATLSFGMQGSVTQYRAAYSQVELSPGGSPIPDPAFSEDINKVLFNAGAGVYFNSDKFYLGISVPELLRNKLTSQSVSAGGELSRQALHLFVASGVVLPVGDSFKLKPSFLFKGVEGAPLEADINGTIWFKDFIAVGAQYRTSADISAMVELQATPQIRVGYSYDRSLTSLRSYGSGSHEVMLRYEFGFQPDKVLSPRYF